MERLRQFDESEIGARGESTATDATHTLIETDEAETGAAAESRRREMTYGARNDDRVEILTLEESILTEFGETIGKNDGAKIFALSEGTLPDRLDRRRDNDATEHLAQAESALGDADDRLRYGILLGWVGFGVEDNGGLVLIEEHAVGCAESWVRLIDRNMFKGGETVSDIKSALDMGDGGRYGEASHLAAPLEGILGDLVDSETGDSVRDDNIQDIIDEREGGR